MRRILSIPLLVLTFLLLCVAILLLWLYANDSVYYRLMQPLSLDDHVRLGDLYFNQGNDPRGIYDLERAYFHYEQAIRIDHDGHPRPWYELGRIDFVEGRLEHALAKLHTQFELFGNEVSNVHYMLGLVYGYKARESGLARDWREAERAFVTFLDLSPEAPWTRVDLAWVYFAQGKYEAMLPVLEEGLAYRPDNPWLHNMYGLALLNTGETARAREHFLQAEREAAALTTQAWGLAYAGNDPQNWEQGLREFRMAIERNLALTEVRE